MHSSSYRDNLLYYIKALPVCMTLAHRVCISCNPHLVFLFLKGILNDCTFYEDQIQCNILRTMVLALVLKTKLVNVQAFVLFQFECLGKLKWVFCRSSQKNQYQTALALSLSRSFSSLSKSKRNIIEAHILFECLYPISMFFFVFLVA